MNVALLSPASSPGLASSSSTLKPRFAAQRSYMRSIISAQSCASVPPVPDCSVTTASPVSYSPLNSAASCSCSSSARSGSERGRDLALQFAAVHRGELACVVVVAHERAVAVEPSRDARVLGGNLRGPVLVVPEAGRVHLLFELYDAAFE